ncbi:MAG TPA: imelysin family protein [Puia sp.]|nr:imelysin family protein [Puia sp.]
MKTKHLNFYILVFIFFGCHKAPSAPAISSTDMEATVIKDFVSNVALGQYSNLTNAAVALNGAITSLNSNLTNDNLVAAQTAWKNLRQVWEQSEGFLFGPVEDNDYDPNTDTWPTDYVQMDSVLASSNPLQVSDVASLQQSLRGYHPLEYIIFGKGEVRTVAQLNPRLMQYATSLAADILYNNVQPLYESWASNSNGYAQQVLNAGNGSSKFPTRRDLFITIVSAMSDICDEVGREKMYGPFINHDSTITESPYSNNTLTDFKNNIIGARNVYLGLNNGSGIKDLVASKNKNLNNQIQSQMNAAISSFDNITVSYEQAIFIQRTQVQQTITQINALNDLLDNDLKNFIIQYVQD